MPRQTTDTTAYVPNPLYAEHFETWRKLRDIQAGDGGFLNPSKPYLMAHPREWLDHSYKTPDGAAGDDGTPGMPGRWVVNPSPSQPSPKLKARRRLARYENIAGTLLAQLAGTLFRKAPVRSFGKDNIPDTHPLRRFWANADGEGASIDALMRESWISAGTFGHSLLYALGNDAGPTRADRGQTVVRLYTPLDCVDWLLTDAGHLAAVRLISAGRRESLDDPLGSSEVIDVDAEGWQVRRLLAKGGKQTLSDASEWGVHGFGVLPVVPLYARRRLFAPPLGTSVLGDPQSHLDLYNLNSELRELLRNQTFGLLSVTIGEGGDVEREQTLMGQAAGTANVVFTSNGMEYVSPDPENVRVYMESIEKLTRTIYRLAIVAWESDSRDAESAESRKIKREDLYAALAGFAAECQLTETKLAELVYRGAYGPQWQRYWDDEQPSVAYPDSFEMTALLDEIEVAVQGLALELGETATRELKRRAVPKLLPGLRKDVAKQIDDDINAMETAPKPDPFARLVPARLDDPIPEDAIN